MQHWSHHRNARDKATSAGKVPSSRRLFNPTPEELRTLVLDYLCHNSYSNAARAFIRDSSVKHLDADGDEMMMNVERGDTDELATTLEGKLAFSELRKEIRMHILSGQVDEAIDMLDRHFPKVLSDEEDIDDIPIPNSSEKFSYIPSTSIDPTHLALNLRIQAFIEAARCVPLSSDTQGHDSPTISPRSPLLPTQNASEIESARQAELLHRAQSLYSSVNCLTKPADRALYITELSQVSGLLAYPYPEGSPMAPYLAQGRREAVADQIDSAILCRAERPSISTTELYTRYTTSIWSALHDMDVKPPPAAKWPAGVHLPFTSQAPTQLKAPEPSSNTPVPAKKSSAERDPGEPVPLFDLSEFLGSKS